LDVLNIRQQLETYAVTLAVQKISEQDINNLETIVQQMEEAVLSGDALYFSNLNSKFHKCIIRISENKKLMEICDNLYKQSEHWIKALGVPERLRHSLEEHKEIYQALREKDVESSRQAMHTHLENVITNVCQNGWKGDTEKNEED